MHHFEEAFAARILQNAGEAKLDPAHDILHVQRVVETARQLALTEGAQLEIVLPAAWLHDFVIIPKNDPRRSQASRLSSQAAVEFLVELNYPRQFHQGIAHAIEAHSYSAKIHPQTLEAEIVQDADRLDGLGAIGIARCFATSGLLHRSFYSVLDPFCADRAPDDACFTVDHFYAKLFSTAATLKSKAGRQEGVQRTATMQLFLKELAREVGAARP
jgi:uncharacterized protein